MHGNEYGLITRLRRWASEEDGAALTEFVVTLPVFILIFSAAAWIGDAYQKSVQTNIDASYDMWNRATTIQHVRVPTSIPNQGSGFAGDLTSTMHPTTGNAGWLVRKQSKGDTDLVSDVMQGTTNAAGAVHGTHGESAAHTLPFTGFMSANQSDVREQANENIQGGHADFAMTMVNDGPGSSNTSNSSQSGSSAFGDLMPSFSGAEQAANGLAPSLGANVRWGGVYGYAENTDYQVGSVATMDFKAGFDVKAPPFAPDGTNDIGPAADELATVGISRGAALISGMHCYPAEVPGIQSNSDFANCNSN
jgi:hypothetical protein